MNLIVPVVRPNHALQRTRHGVVVCNRCVPCAGSLSLGRYAASTTPPRPQVNPTAL